MAKGLVLMLKEEGVKGYFEATLEALNKLSDKEELDEKFIYDSKLRAVMANANAYIDTLESVKPEILDKSRTIKSNALMIYAILSLDLNLESILPLPKDAKKDLQTIYKKLHASLYIYMQANQMTNIEELETDDKIQDFVRIIEKVTATFEKKPSKDFKKKIKKIKTITETELYNPLPSSNPNDLVYKTLSAGGKIAEIPKREKGISHSKEYEVKKHGKERQLTSTSKDEEIKIFIPDIDKIAGNNKGAKKLFNLTLQKANEQAVHQGELTKEIVSFPLNELVDIGMYTNIDSARRGFLNSIKTITTLQVYDKVTKGKRTIQNGLNVLFTGGKILNSQCIVKLNNDPDVKWNLIFRFFTILPNYYYILSNNSSDLCYKIFYLARQNAKTIKEKGYFNISLKVIWEALFLPDVSETKDPRGKILDKIEAAVKELEEVSAEYGNELKLELVYDKNQSITEILNSGYLRVHITGEAREYFGKRQDDTVKKIEATQKKAERRLFKCRGG